jgi:predicted nucleic acid-binding protein
VTDHLLDSTALVDYFRRRTGAVEFLNKLEAQGHSLVVCAVGLAEVYSGFSAQERIENEPVLDRWLYFETTPAIAKEAGKYRYEFARGGVTLSATDSLIAAVAIANDAILVTNNVRDFPMDGIRLLRHD